MKYCKLNPTTATTADIIDTCSAIVDTIVNHAVNHEQNSCSNIAVNSDENKALQSDTTSDTSPSIHAVTVQGINAVQTNSTVQPMTVGGDKGDISSASINDSCNDDMMMFSDEDELVDTQLSKQIDKVHSMLLMDRLKKKKRQPIL